MSNPQEWYFTDAAGQQTGPITPEQLQQLAASGQITAETNVWTEGLAEWLPATQVEGLIPAAPMAAAVPAQAPMQAAAPAQALASNPYASPGYGAQAAPQAGGDYPIPVVGKANFKLYVSLLLGGIALFIGGAALAGSESTAGLGVALFFIGGLMMIWPAILNYVFLYRIWALIQPGGASISPGKAVGFLFIPIFGAIWAFIVLFKLPGEWNEITSRYSNTQSAPKLGIGTVFCLIFIPVIGSILWVAEISKAINFMVNARMMPVQNTQPAAGGGGLSFY
ncbi:DUF4339 domain-containing protein [Verrucomicrobiaceae bacterium N1E253]|uniref:DUF4339 domain-containing protein n=1 Tax=Oceaniferula marina TaxID=2748318 RepID=A0A851GF71_9BACT|nr:DUF4339 domain-containing protein [Oceaniferula marina]NWK56398.1 DUF4339 domain-containing protein [Oceaniferula marina]